MDDRKRRGPSNPATPATPDDLLMRVAGLFDWHLKLRNVMLEGDHDETYCKCASDRHFDATGHRLLDNDFAVFACGKYKEGGVWNLEDRARTLANLMRRTPKDGRGRDYRVIALFDDDGAGRDRFNALTDRRQSLWVPYRHAFLVKRHYPRTKEFQNDSYYELLAANAAWKGMDCEIEDLLSRSFLENFRMSNPGACTKNPILHVDGVGHHYEWERRGKDQLADFVKDNATATDLKLLIEMLKSFRWLLGLMPDGT